MNDSQLVGEVLQENILDVARMLHRTFLSEDAVMPIDESLTRRFGPIVNEKLFVVRML